MPRTRLVLLAVVAAVLAAGAAALLTRPSDDPVDVCVEQASEHQDVAFDGPVTSEQIEQFCRDIIAGKDVLGG